VLTVVREGGAGMKRMRQIDKACYLKWKAAKKRKEYVLPFGWIMWKKKILRKMGKITFKTVPIRMPIIEKMLVATFRNHVKEKLAQIEEQVKVVQK
jgi:hypothetical protein